MKKIRFSAFLLLLSLGLILSSCASGIESGTEDETDENTIVIARKDTPCEYVVVNGATGTASEKCRELTDALSGISGTEVASDEESWADKTSKNKYELLIGEIYREGVTEQIGTLKRNDFVIKALPDTENGSVRILISFYDPAAGVAAINYFMENYMTEEKCAVPADLNFRSNASEYDTRITTNIACLRDPYAILAPDGTYYIYGTGWYCCKNTSGSLAGEWSAPQNCVTVPEDAENDFWAPEVYYYHDAYYMFTTYRSKEYGHHGCTILRSDSPEGPFAEITGGIITPHDRDSIDGTFYVDEDGQPWMIFVDEWISTEDGIGRFAAMKLSDDLTSAISEPFELFRADDGGWNGSNPVTDGCWMYRTEDGQLLMLWSSWDNSGYAVGIARSSDGKLTGKWTHDPDVLYSGSFFGDYDGGHGMIFTDKDGKMYLLFHSPNEATNARKEKPVFLPVTEKDGKLIPGL